MKNVYQYNDAYIQPDFWNEEFYEWFNIYDIDVINKIIGGNWIVYDYFRRIQV